MAEGGHVGAAGSLVPLAGTTGQLAGQPLQSRPAALVFSLAVLAAVARQRTAFSSPPTAAFETRHQLDLPAGGDEGNTGSLGVTALLGPLPRHAVGAWAGLLCRVLRLVERVALHVLQGGRRGVARHQLCLAAVVLGHAQAEGSAAGVALSPDDEAQPEPDVAGEHEEADQEDQVDGLVIRCRAGFLYLDQGGVMHPVVGV